MEHDICVLGLGYIGLPTASIFATRGQQVLGVDVTQSVVDTINQGQIHIEEPDLDIMVQTAVGSGKLTASTTPAEAKTYILAVPTPFRPVGDNPRSPDLTYVESAARSIAPVIANGALVILESTSPVGTTEKVRDWVHEELDKLGRSEIDRETLCFAHCPERILPGQMLKELVSNDRVSGGLTPEASERAKELYALFCTGENLITDARTAEMAKLTENASRDVSIAFANELSIICDRLNIDVWELIRIANHHPRVNILQPGPGVGGHCIAVDPWFIVDAAPDETPLIRTAREVNDGKPNHVVESVRKHADRFKEPVIACLGLAFKANVDDLRESPALDIVEELATAGVGKVLAVEPHIRELPEKLAKAGAEFASGEEAVEQADIVVLLVDHSSFASLPRELLTQKVLIDTRGFFR